MNPTLKALAKAGGTTDHAAWIRGGKDGANAALLVQFMNERMGLLDKNPYELSVELQLTALRRASDEEKWGITEEDFARLAATAPAWPQGKQAYRSLRVRFGEGSEGVQQTFERHVARIKSVFGASYFWRWEHLHSGKVPYKGKPVDRLRLLSGDNTHKAVIEWVIVDLGTHRKRDSITAVRGVKSLADELLVVTWMFPDMIRAIDYENLPGLFAAGYESNVPEDGDERWQYVVIVHFDRGNRQVLVDALDRGNVGVEAELEGLGPAERGRAGRPIAARVAGSRRVPGRPLGNRTSIPCTYGGTDFGRCFWKKCSAPPLTPSGHRSRAVGRPPICPIIASPTAR